MSKGKVFVLSGPSGVGKGTVRAKLDFEKLNLVNSVSYTTRSPRPGEIPGVNYYYVSEQEFQKAIEEDAFLEYAGYGPKAYGTPKAPIEKWISEGKNVLLEIEVNGAKQVMSKMPECDSIFLVPPAMEDLRKRLCGRNSENPEQIEQRLAIAQKELQEKDCYRHIVVNRDVDQAAKEIEAIILGDLKQ
jgi:guanylate kinase